MKNNVVGLIAVRLKSKRLPKKALAELDNLPLIQRLHERLLKSNLLNEIVWCTSTNPEDDPLEKIAKTLKAKERDKYIVVMFIDPEVTKDSKTKNVKEITIQFTFFDYTEYKKDES